MKTLDLSLEEIEAYVEKQPQGGLVARANKPGMCLIARAASAKLDESVNVFPKLIGTGHAYSNENEYVLTEEQNQLANKFDARFGIYGRNLAMREEVLFWLRQIET